VHVDLATTSAARQGELVRRLTELSATPADVGQGDVPSTVLADPEGDELRVLDLLQAETGPIASMVVDCADPRAMVRFWGHTMDRTVREVTDHKAVLRPGGQRVLSARPQLIRRERGQPRARRNSGLRAAASVDSELLSTTMRQSSAGTQAAKARKPGFSPEWWNQAWPPVDPTYQP
jgi:hypothetical protein